MTERAPIDRPQDEGAGPVGRGAPTADEPATSPRPATAPDREPPETPPPAPPTTAEAGPPPSGPHEPGRRRRDQRGLPILGIVLILLGLGLLLERLVPGLGLGDVWPYGSIALGLALVLASLRVGSDANS